MIRFAAVLFSFCFVMFGQDSGLARPKPAPFPVRPAVPGPVASPGPPLIGARPPPPSLQESANGDEMKELSGGTAREQVLTLLGAPASRISMFEDGHMLESYRYSVGRIRLVDGHVTMVEVAQ